MLCGNTFQGQYIWNMLPLHSPLTASRYTQSCWKSPLLAPSLYQVSNCKVPWGLASGLRCFPHSPQWAHSPPWLCLPSVCLWLSNSVSQTLLLSCKFIYNPHLLLSPPSLPFYLLCSLYYIYTCTATQRLWSFMALLSQYLWNLSYFSHRLRNQNKSLCFRIL